MSNDRENEEMKIDKDTLDEIINKELERLIKKRIMGS